MRSKIKADVNLCPAVRLNDGSVVWKDANGLPFETRLGLIVTMGISTGSILDRGVVDRRTGQYQPEERWKE